MKTKTFFTSAYCPDAVFLIIQIIERMGWTHDEPDEDGDMLVNIPEKDKPLFDFLDNCFS